MGTDMICAVAALATLGIALAVQRRIQDRAARISTCTGDGRWAETEAGSDVGTLAGQTCMSARDRA